MRPNEPKWKDNQDVNYVDYGGAVMPHYGHAHIEIPHDPSSHKNAVQDHGDSDIHFGVHGHVDAADHDHDNNGIADHDDDGCPNNDGGAADGAGGDDGGGGGGCGGGGCGGGGCGGCGGGD